MNCIKCGRETQGGQVFCQDCQAEMEKYPVKPGTPLVLPSRPAQPPVKKKPARRRNLRPEEQVPILKGKVRWLTAALIVAILAFLLAAALLVLVTEGWGFPGLTVGA